VNIVSTQRTYKLKERAKSQEETRQRIVAATAALHEEVGPARTTVTEIAKRAGVQRLTVYKHFPGEAELFEGCSAHFMEAHPFPDPSEALATEDPRERVQRTLALLYGWFRETEQMTAHIQRDRLLIPAIDRRASMAMDAPLQAIADALTAGFRARGKRTERIGALVAVAMDFWSWRLLKQRPMTDEAAAELMADAVAGA
jgi:AcrR family transcriptional regulator